MTRVLRPRESGAAAIFIVVFASLLLMIITLSFVRLMLVDQSQATTNDLSQSAYNSALSGVEDGKRLLLLQQSCGSTASPTCTAANKAISDNKCTTISAGLGLSGNVGSAALDQSYTCVKITTDTLDYRKTLSVGQSQVIPLRSTAAFDAVVISWYSKDDLSSGTTANLPAGVTTPLPTSWTVNRPPIIRAQFMQTGNSFTLADLDSAMGSNTVFLYPFKGVGFNATSIPIPDVSTSGRRVAPPSSPYGVSCTTAFVAPFSCSVKINYTPPATGTFSDRGAYLRLSSIYGDAHYSVQLLKGSTPVTFSGVQPIIDVTGRANNMFRRVLARVELSGSFTYPEAAIDLKNDLCKDFSVTDTGYTPNTCDPTVQTP
jgi:Tfp pilus assembly protein PilX